MAKRTDSKAPMIRFKGFTQEWDEKLIGNVFSEKKRPIVLKDDQEYELITVKRRNGGVVSRGYLLGRNILVKNYSQLEAGDFVISKRQVVHGATGIIPEELDKAIVSNEYLATESNDEILTNFWALLSCLPEMKRKFLLSSYGVDIEKLFFDANDWKQRTVTIPKPTEQTKIGTYFKKLDLIIELHQRKHDQLITLKQAMLQKMFPQNGATTPEIRFKGFEGEWKEKPFNLIASRTTLFCSEEGFPRLEYEDIISNSGRLNKDILKKKSSKQGIKFEGGDVLFGKLRPYLRNWLLASFEGIAVGDFWVLKPSKTDSLFLYRLIQTEAFEKIANQSAGSKMPRSDWKLVSNALFFIPSSLAEQHKIGTYFSKLDELISRHATQLRKLKQIKSACLEKMFV